VRPLRPIVVAVMLPSLLLASAPTDAGELKPGWTTDALAKESAACTEQLVQGAWDNTKRAQGADPSLPLTQEIREQLAPQIAAMTKLCACAVRAGAERYTKAEAEGAPKDLERFVTETISKGTCTLDE
jgi:hypothetical protein